MSTSTGYLFSSSPSTKKIIDSPFVSQTKENLLNLSNLVCTIATDALGESEENYRPPCSNIVRNNNRNTNHNKKNEMGNGVSGDLSDDDVNNNKNKDATHRIRTHLNSASIPLQESLSFMCGAVGDNVMGPPVTPEKATRTPKNPSTPATEAASPEPSPLRVGLLRRMVVGTCGNNADVDDYSYLVDPITRGDNDGPPTTIVKRPTASMDGGYGVGAGGIHPVGSNVGSAFDAETKDVPTNVDTAVVAKIDPTKRGDADSPALLESVVTFDTEDKVEFQLFPGAAAASTAASVVKDVASVAKDAASVATQRTLGTLTSHLTSAARRAATATSTPSSAPSVPKPPPRRPLGRTTVLHRLAADGDWGGLRVRLLSRDDAADESGVHDTEGRTPLALACAHGPALPADVARLLLVARRGSETGPALRAACASGCSREIVAVLLEARPEEARTADARGSLPLHAAMRVERSTQDVANTEGVVELLVTTWPEAVSMRNDKGETPLLLAMYRRAPLVILRTLLRARPEAAGVPDAFGSYPLHFCDRLDDDDDNEDALSFVRDLARARPDVVGIPNRAGETPLFAAAEDRADPAVMSVLTEEAARAEGRAFVHRAVIHRNARGRTALAAAWETLRRRRIVAAEDEEEEERRVERNEHLVATAKSPEELEGDLVDFWKRATALVRAAYRRFQTEEEEDDDDDDDDQSNFPIVHAFLRAECPRDLVEFVLRTHPCEARTLRDRWGSTPLHLGAKCPAVVDTETIIALYETDPAAIRAKDHNGCTPLHLACLHNAPLKTIQELVRLDTYDDNAPAASTPNRAGQTPLFGALAVGRSAGVIEALLRGCPAAASVRDVHGVSTVALCWTMLVSGRTGLGGGADTFDSAATFTDATLVGPSVFLRAARVNRDIVAAAEHPAALTGAASDWTRKVESLLRAARHGSIDDVRIWRPVHAAAGGGICPPEVLELACRLFPNAVRARDGAGRTPLRVHAAAPPHHHRYALCPGLDDGRGIDVLLRARPEAAAATDREGRAPLHAALAHGRSWAGGVAALVDAFPEAVRTRDPVTLMFPFMLAAVDANEREDVVANMTYEVTVEEVVTEVKEEENKEKDELVVEEKPVKEPAPNEGETVPDTVDDTETSRKLFPEDETSTTTQNAADQQDTESANSLLVVNVDDHVSTDKKKKDDDNVPLAATGEMTSDPVLEARTEVVESSDSVEVSEQSLDTPVESLDAVLDAEQSEKEPTSAPMHDPAPPVVAPPTTTTTTTTVLVTKTVTVPTTPDLASVNTVYHLLRAAPELVVSPRTNDAENRYLRRTRRELREENDRLRRLLAARDGEIEERSSPRERWERAARREEEASSARERELATRAGELERTCGAHQSWLSGVERTVVSLRSTEQGL